MKMIGLIYAAAAADVAAAAAALAADFEALAAALAYGLLVYIYICYSCLVRGARKLTEALAALAAALSDDAAYKELMIVLKNFIYCYLEQVNFIRD